MADDGNDAASGAAAEGGSAELEASKNGSFSTASIYTLGFLTLIGTLNYFDRSVMSLVLPAIKAEMGLSDTTLGLVASLVSAYAIVGIPVAILADRWSRKNVIAIGFFLWSGLTVLTGFAANVWHLGIMRFFMASAESAGLAPANAMLSDVFSKQKLPMALAILTTASSLAFVIYAPGAGWIADTYGWRMVFYVAGAPGLVLALIFFFTVKEPKRGATSLRPVKEEHSTFMETVRFVLKARSYIFLVAGSAFLGAFLQGQGTWAPTFLHRVHGLDYSEIGFVIGPARGLASAAGVILGGAITTYLAKRDERWRGWLPGIYCFMLAPAELLFIFADTKPLMIAGLVLSGFFGLAYMAPVFSGLLSVAKPHMRSTATAISAFSATVIGAIPGPILMGALTDWLTPRFGDLAIRYSFLVIVLFCLIGGALYFCVSFTIAKDSKRAEE